jgi:hypothetical protein
MRFLTVLLITTLFSGLAFAASGGGEGMMSERARINAFGGYGLLNPTGVNNFIGAVGGSPAENKLSNFFYYGGQIAYMVTHRVAVVGEYVQESASNPVNNSIGNNSGVQLSMNAFYAGLDYYLVDHGNIRVYVEGLVGYPNRAHATVVEGAYTQLDSTFSPIAKGMATFDFKLGHRFSVFASAGYEYNMLSALTNGGATLTANGSNVVFDMSGVRAQAGLNIYF